MSNVEVIAAYGCERVGQHKAAKILLKTVALDYYGS